MRVLFQGALKRTNSDLRNMKPGDKAVMVELVGRPSPASANNIGYLTVDDADTLVKLSQVQVVAIEGHKGDTIGGRKVPLSPDYVPSNTPIPSDGVDKVTVLDSDGAERTFLYGTHTEWLNEDNFPASAAIRVTQSYPNPNGMVRLIPLAEFLEKPMRTFFRLPQEK